MREALIATINTMPDSSTALGAIEAAGRTNTKWFWIYVLWLVLSSVVTVIFTYVLWNSSNQQMRAVTEYFSGQAAEALIRQKQVEIELAKAQKELEETRRQTAKIDRWQLPRFVQEEEKERFKAATAGMNKSLEITVAPYEDNDAEARNYAHAIIDTLTNAGFAAKILIGNPIENWAEDQKFVKQFREEPTGITFVFRPSFYQGFRTEESLAAGFQKINLRYSKQLSGRTKDRFLIVIAQKPPNRLDR